MAVVQCAERNQRTNEQVASYLSPSTTTTLQGKSGDCFVGSAIAALDLLKTKHLFLTLVVISLLTVATSLEAQNNAAPMPQPEVQYLDAAGHPLAGAKLCTYNAGTSTPLATYTDAGAGTPNTNPVILDSAGRASVWVKQLFYKFVLRTGGDGTCLTGSVVFSQDNVIAIFQQVTSLNGLIGAVNLTGSTNQVTITPVGNVLQFTLPQAIGTSSNVTFGTITGTSLTLTNGPVTLSGISVVDTGRNINGNSYAINGNGIVDAAANATLHAVSIQGFGSPSIDNANNFSGHSLTIDGSIAIDNARNGAFHNMQITGACVGCFPGAFTAQTGSFGSHVLGTIYQNVDPTARLVTVSVTLNSNSSLKIYTDPFPTPTATVAAGSTPPPVVSQSSYTFVVLPGSYYQVQITSGTGTLNSWTEWSS